MLRTASLANFRYNDGLNTYSFHKHPTNAKSDWATCKRLRLNANMPDSRTNQEVADRLDIKLERRPNPMFPQRRWLTLVCGIAPLIFVAVYAVRDDQTIYWSRPVSTGHELIRNDCQQCHQSAWQPLVRLTTLDNNARSVRDNDCQTCHLQRGDDHHKLPDNVTAPACATCHQEHRGKTSLSEVADAFCIQCHGSDVHSVVKNFAGNIDSFKVHPEFATHRDSQVDDTALKFSHEGHLKPLLVPAGYPHPAEDQAAGDGPNRVQLGCADCHQPDAAGQYMSPIVYEDHCAKCHPLQFSGKITSDQPLPHESLDIVHGVLRDQLMKYARQHPEEVSRGSDVGTSRLPNKQQSRRIGAKDEWEWVERELKALEGDVFHNPLKNGCLKCHTGDMSEGGGPGLQLWLAPTRIPDRWLTHSRFRHDRHRELACTVCHHTPDKREDVLRMTGTPIMLESKAVQDVLMPSIEVCRLCHGDQRTSTAAGRARSSCVECHQYHHVDNSHASVGRSLIDLLPDGKSDE
jgi:hypothetical protein